MITLPLQEVKRKEYLEEVGISVSRDEALEEAKHLESLIPVCLMTYPMFGMTMILLTVEDFHWESSQPTKQTDWYLLDIGSIEKDFPQLISTIDSIRRIK